jgi:hypothetical protein
VLSVARDDETARVQLVRREAVRRSGARTLGIVHCNSGRRALWVLFPGD